MQDLIEIVKSSLETDLSNPINPGLYLVATPIGNLTDISLRALTTLARADIIYCEDTRHSRKLTAHFQIKSKLKTYHEHNAATERPVILDLLSDGKSIALISDAGTPLISDPGFKLVNDVLKAGHHVSAIPGPSAPITALSMSGLPTDRFFFEGFLPAKQKARLERLDTLNETQGTLIFFESANRLIATLTDMANCFGSREAVIARELTKLHETVYRDALPNLVSELSGLNVKGEIVILVAPYQPEEITDSQIQECLRTNLKSQTFRDAVKTTTDMLNVKKNRVYQIGLALTNTDDKTGAP